MEYDLPYAHTIAAGGIFLEGTYGVYFGENLCGKVQISRKGLYYRFICRCQLKGDIVCRLRICFPGGEENLGIVVPVDDGFGLSTQIPVKKFKEKPVRFYLVPKHSTSEGKFVPIYPDEPFAYIEHLKDAYLSRKNGQTGVIIK